MNRNEHILISGIGTAILDLFDQAESGEPINFLQTLFSSFVGSIGGTIPDIVEPSFRNPNHRGFFHSVAASGVLHLSENMIKSSENVHPFVKKLFIDLSRGYKFHLLADATTKRSLPLI